MSHSYGSCVLHFVFSTKNRQPLIAQDWRARLWEYLGGIARRNEMTPICIGGTSDHVHIVVSVPPRMAPAKAIQWIKGGSSKWVHQQIPDGSHFAWQEGYGVFSIGFSQIEATREYVQNQKEHHRKISFEEEYRAFLRKHGIEFDEKYLLG